MTQNPSQLICNLADKVTSQISESVYGHADAARLLFGALVIGGHVLIEGPPGIAKTLLAKTFANSLGLNFRRIQFTPDLMPSDITGVNIFEPKSASFHFAPGPLFTDILLADEINRTPPKTQSALLEAMEEHCVTIDGVRRSLGDLFFVIATQNPIEHEGTFPLPEAQLDRFLFKLSLSYPDAKAEKDMVLNFSSALPAFDQETTSQKSITSAAELTQARAALRQITLSPTLAGYIMELVSASRAHPKVLLGASPRAALGLALAAKVIAAFEGRDFVIPDDVKSVVIPSLNHRLILNPESFHAELSSEDILREIISRVAVPKVINE